MTPHRMAMKPARIQRKRTKGWRMPKNTVYVGRPTKWGNPYSLKEMAEHYPNDTPEELLRKVMSDFRGLVEGRWSRDEEGRSYPSRADIRSELRGVNLACWCPLGQACHADILLEVANC